MGALNLLTVQILSLFFFLSGDTVNKITTCGVAVISNPLVCDVCVFHATVFGKQSCLRCCGFLLDLFQT